MLTLPQIEHSQLLWWPGFVNMSRTSGNYYSRFWSHQTTQSKSIRNTKIIVRPFLKRRTLYLINIEQIHIENTHMRARKPSILVSSMLEILNMETIYWKAWSGTQVKVISNTRKSWNSVNVLNMGNVVFFDSTEGITTTHPPTSPTPTHLPTLLAYTCRLQRLILNPPNQFGLCLPSLQTYSAYT